MGSDMLVAQGFVSISQPKTGSTTRDREFRRILGAGSVLHHGVFTYRGHAPLHAIPSEALVGRTVLATIRNPWDWLVSVYQYLKPYNDQAGKDVSGWGNGNTSWEAILYGMTHPGTITTRLPAHEILAPGGFEPGTWGEGLWGYSTWWYNAGSKIILDCDQQNEAWATLFPEHAPALLGCSRMNAQAHPSAKWSWGEEQLRWVWDAHGDIIEWFGFNGPGTPARTAILPPWKWIRDARNIQATI